jgi:glutamate synthase domain-containing protein 2
MFPGKSFGLEVLVRMATVSLIDHVGIPINEIRPRVIDKTGEAGLHDRIKVVASGKLINPAEVARALCVGADFITSARGFMFSLGCIQALQCHRSACPTGITMHDKKYSVVWLQNKNRHVSLIT